MRIPSGRLLQMSLANKFLKINMWIKCSEGFRTVPRNPSKVQNEVCCSLIEFQNVSFGKSVGLKEVLS